MNVSVTSISTKANRFRVPMRVWRRWTGGARLIFNEVYSAMMQNREFFLHPKQPAPTREQWRTTAWNAAWTAAGALKFFTRPE